MMVRRVEIPKAFLRRYLGSALPEPPSAARQRTLPPWILRRAAALSGAHQARLGCVALLPLGLETHRRTGYGRIARGDKGGAARGDLELPFDFHMIAVGGGLRGAVGLVIAPPPCRSASERWSQFPAEHTSRESNRRSMMRRARGGDQAIARQPFIEVMERGK